MSAKGSETPQLDLKSELSVLARALVEGDRTKALGLLTECLPKISAREGFMPAFIETLKAHGGRATALACVNTAREAFPKNTDLKLYRVDLLARLGKLEAARLALTGLASESHRPIYWKHKLAVAVGSDQLAVAQQGLEDSQDVPRDSQVLRHAEINVLMAQGEYDAATKKSGEALRTYSNACSLHVQHVRLILARDGARAALPLAHAVAERFKDALHAQLVVADCLRAVGQHNEALKHLDTITRHFPHSALPKVRLARINLELGYRYKALNHIRAARTLDAGTPPVELTYADILIKLGRREDAVGRLKWLVENEQATPSILVKLIKCLVELRFLDDAESYTRLAHEMFPNSVTLSENSILGEGIANPLAGETPSVSISQSRLRLLKARLALDALDTDLALAIMRKTPSPYREPKVISLIAQALMQAGKIALAWRYLWFCLGYWPVEPSILSLFAQAANKCGRQSETISILKAGRRQDLKQSPAIQSNLILLHAAIGESDAAFAAFRTCLAQGGFPQQNAYRLLLRCMIADGRAAKLRLLIETQEASGLWKVPHPQKTYHGQLITEVKIALASGPYSPTQKVWPQNRMGHVALMQDHPESNVAAMRVMRNWILFAPPARLGEKDQTRRQVIQYWDTVTPPSRIADMMETWARQPGYTYRRFNRSTGASYLRDNYDSPTLQAFRLARNPAEEADFFRLCLLAQEGGVYADADDRLTGNLDAVLPTGASFVAVLEPGLANVGNNFIAAAPHHPLLIDAVGRAQAALLSRSSETTWSKTGPGLLTRALARELTRAKKRDVGAGIAVLTLSDITGKIAIHNAAEHKRAATDWRIT